MDKREIKFRGLARRTSNRTEWVYGLPAYHKDEIYGIQTKYGTTINVDIDTIGQYTGLKDMEGVELYEGDIVTGEATAENGSFSYTGKVVFCNYNYMNGYHIKHIQGGYWEISQVSARVSVNHISGTIIGNVYENSKSRA